MIAVRTAPLLLLPIAVFARAAPPSTVETIDVIATPLGAFDASGAAPGTTVVMADDLRRSHALDVSSYLNDVVAGISINETQGNPLQPDVQLRGFVGSPLLGTPEGIAVYQDGARVNEPFGDTVNWSAIPEVAVARVRVMPGSNALFGQNALGGAIAVDTKDGFADHGARFDVSGGSFGRMEAGGELGGTVGDSLAGFVAGSYLDEDGWRDHSPTDAKQLFGKLSWQADETRVDLAVTRVDARMLGNGASPAALLAQSRAAVFTFPDRTDQDLTLVSLEARRTISDSLELVAEAYYRASNIRTLNGDTSDYVACDATPEVLCEVGDEGETPIFDPSGAQIPASAALSSATLNRTDTDQDGAGFSTQLSGDEEIAGHAVHAVLGFAYDGSATSFSSDTELGALNTSRGAVAGGALVGDAFVRLHADAASRSAFAGASIRLATPLTLTLSARLNDAQVDLSDRLGDALDGDHAFTHLNPAVGLDYALSPAAVLYAAYSESNRAPSPVELTCADPDAPCRLPNAFVSDPKLHQVVASTFEVGARGETRGVAWRASAFTTTNHDDIYFVSSGPFTNEGFFENVGRTQRDGIEAEVSETTARRLRWYLSASYLDATFERDFSVPSPNHPQAVDGEIAVHSGDRLPLVPEYLVKAGVEVELTDSLSCGIDARGSSGVYLRGDEGNLASKTDSYGVLNLHAEYRVAARASVYVRVENLLDARYETFGTFGDVNGLVAGPEQQRFLTPGAPLGAWLGVELAL